MRTEAGDEGMCMLFQKLNANYSAQDETHAAQTIQLLVHKSINHCIKYC